MLRPTVFLFIYAAACWSQSPTNPPLAEALSFEAPSSGGKPEGWGFQPAETVALDDREVHGGKYSARLERSPGSARGYSNLSLSLPLDFTGKTIEFRGFLKTKEVAGFAAIALREDDPSGNVIEFYSMENHHPVTGTTGWTQWSVQLPINPSATQFSLFVILNGPGTAWADDLEVFIDGKLLVEHRPPEREADHEFDSGSRITIKDLTSVQIENLVTLGKVWGFLKYYHPQIAAGKYQWDYALFRILPHVLEATSREAASAEMAAWVNQFGRLRRCDPCSGGSEGEVQMFPAVDWIAGGGLLGRPLSARLLFMRENRWPDVPLYFATDPSGATKLSFDRELKYENVPLTDSGFQLLALYRFWNAVQYWSPARDGMHEDWDSVLAQFIPRILLARDAVAYQRELLALMSRVHDGNSNLSNAAEVAAPTGSCQAPVFIRFLGEQAVISGFAVDPERIKELQRGDVVEAIDGVLVSDLVSRLAPFYPASSPAAQLRDLSKNLARGDCSSSARLRVRRGSEEREVEVGRLPVRNLDSHDLPGPAFQMLSGRIAYLKLSAFRTDEVRNYMEKGADAAGWILDVRSNPSADAISSLAPLFTDKPVEFARFSVAGFANPGTFHWLGDAAALKPVAPGYHGKLVILVDEVTEGQGELVAMAFQSIPGARVAGSRTAGTAVGKVALPLVGGLSTSISAFGVFYPDKRSTQRTGVILDLEVKPTLAGIASGRDEVLEAAIVSCQAHL